jgi:hypothetical protein
MDNMQLSYFVQRLKNFTLQNMSSDFFDDVDWVYHINTSLVYIYNYMNANGNWYRTNKTEDITAVLDTVNGDTIWNTTYKLSRVWKIWDTTSPTSPMPLLPSNVSFFLDENIY